MEKEKIHTCDHPDILAAGTLAVAQLTSNIAVAGTIIFVLYFDFYK